MSGNARRLTHSAYTVAWICALPCELTASLAVLDEVHADLENPPGDLNVYSYGEISGHNVVLTCLPSGVYGLTSATRVGERLCRTFESITVPLMVGIGGGVPSSSHDIRLGDVVVSVPTSSPACPAVVQHDYGKAISSRCFIRTGTLNKPAALLLAAVSKLRSIHNLHPPQMPAIIAKALRNGRLQEQHYIYPGFQQDILYETSCEHVDEPEQCLQCGPTKQINRQPRTTSFPAVFYGPIASGNSVIKNSKIRDATARPLGILCFEMEAAGLMDTLPCLVIRGICDYCDSHKAKQFQQYASLTAAAFAKELLSVVPKALPVRDEVRQLVLESLGFEAAGDRLMAIKPAHPKTCAWFLSDPVYKQWLDDSMLKDHHGLLWIKGKPGAGKSTIMKYVLEQMGSGFTLLSFFFNARGKTELERSTSGLYRSFLYQLLKLYPELQKSVDWFDQPNNIRRWNLDILQNVFVSAIKAIGRKHLICYIDALDESTEEEIRDMVEVFEQLGELTASSEILLRVCYSSRYYPQISIRAGLEIRLDERDGHWLDIKNYIDAELHVRSADLGGLKADIVSKSAGIFLWAVLAVKILRREIDSGRVYNLRNKLQTIPPKLSDLFRDIIRRDAGENPNAEDLSQFLICLQWLLYAVRPLSPSEFYFAMLASEPTDVMTAWDRSAVTIDDMTKYVSTVSKGLAESTTPKSTDKSPRVDVATYRISWIPISPRDRKVQFIHESVREFLLRPEEMLEIWPGFEALSEQPSNERLRVCCTTYLQRAVFPNTQFSSSYRDTEIRTLRERLRLTYPFIQYAMQNLLLHDGRALSNGNSTAHSIQSANIKRWLDLNTLLRESAPVLPPTSDSILAIAIRENHEDNALYMLKSRPDINFLYDQGRTPLHFAAKNSSKSIALALLAAGASVNATDSAGRTPLHEASAEPKINVVKVLVEANAEVNVADATGATPLHLAAQHGGDGILSFLITAKANVDAVDDVGMTPLHYAAYWGRWRAIEILLRENANANITSHDGSTPFHLAASAENEFSLIALLKHQENIDATDTRGRTALHLAAAAQRYRSVHYLVSIGARIDILDNEGMIPLQLASQGSDSYYILQDTPVRTLMDSFNS